MDGALRTVDVVVPVFRDVGRTQACIESVLSSRNETQLHLVVINDASPEAVLTQWLRDRADSAGFELIEHADNRGFVASANEGLRLHPDRDVVLLNSDTEVANDWLDRLCACADLDPRTATVTPFSNNATICSFPVPNVANTLPVGWTVARLDALFARVNAGQSHEIPTGVGFCLYVRRSCLDDIGFFDEQHFGRGYGEENDFCLRAADRGWVNRVCADVFVYHAGHASFGAETLELQQEASAVMAVLHVGYDALVREFAQRDPIAPARGRVAAEVLSQSLADTAAAGPCVLHVLGLGGGGSAQHVRQLAALEGPRAAPMHLILFMGGPTAFLQDLRSGIYYPLDGLATLPVAAATVLQALGVVTIHWHIVNEPAMVLSEALGDTGCRHVVTLHDIGFASPAAFADREESLVQGSEEEAWRERVTGFLRRAEVVLAPSRYVADLCASVTRGTVSVTVLPHPAPVRVEGPPSDVVPEVSRRCREAGFVAGDPVVALIGALGEHKGIGHWRRMREIALEMDRGVNWVLVGYGDPELAPSVQQRCVVHGAYLPEELGPLLAAYGADLVYFPPGMPESFCYALSDVWLAGLPVVVHDRGALGERLREHPEGGWLLPPKLDAAATVDALLTLLHDSVAIERAKAHVREAARNWLTPADRVASMMKEIWMTNTQAVPATTGKIMELQAMLRTQLDDGFFRPELVRLGGENEELRQQMGRLQDAVITLRELADQREQWAGKLERDIDALHQETVVLQQLADQREQWAGKLERDIDALHQETVVLQQLAEQREHWAAKLESDIAEIRQLADQREQWAGKLEDDIVALRQSNASLFDEKQILASTVDGLRKTLCIRGTTWLRGQWAKVWQ